MEETKLAWAAGIIDGEGCIMVCEHRPKRCFTLRVTVTNTDPRMLTAMKSMFGGSICEQRWKGDKPQHRTKWVWVTCSKQAEAALVAMLPYLVTKKDQAELALTFRSLHRKRGGIALIGVRTASNEQLFEQQRWLSKQLQAMKHESLVMEEVPSNA